VRAGLCATVALAVFAAAAATACESGDQDGRTPPTTPDGATTTTTMGGDGKSADIQTGTLTAKTSHVWEMEIGGGNTLHCVQEFDADNNLTYEHCKKIRSK
jgi:hypothetical protein